MLVCCLRLRERRIDFESRATLSRVAHRIVDEFFRSIFVVLTLHRKSHSTCGMHFQEVALCFDAKSETHSATVTIAHTSSWVRLDLVTFRSPSQLFKSQRTHGQQVQKCTKRTECTLKGYAHSLTTKSLTLIT